jgi:hypothetical protein
MKLPKNKRISEVEFLAPTRNPDHAWVRSISGDRFEITCDVDGIHIGKYVWPWTFVSRLTFDDLV